MLTITVGSPGTLVYFNYDRENDDYVYVEHDLQCPLNHRHFSGMQICKSHPYLVLTHREF